MAVCPHCDREKREPTGCTKTPVQFGDGTVLDPLPYGVEKPPVVGEAIDETGIHQFNRMPDWKVPGDMEPKPGLVRLVLCQEKVRDDGRRKSHMNTRHLWTYFPWETPEEAEVRKAALVAEHGYHTRGVDVGDDMAAMFDVGILMPEKPFCGQCTAPIGGYHHPGCSIERCPRCKGQIISCGCLDEEEDEEPETVIVQMARPVALIGNDPGQGTVVTLFPRAVGDADLAALQAAPLPDDYAGFYDPPEQSIF